MPVTERGLVTLGDPSLADIQRTARVERLRKAYFEGCPEICVERPKRVTAAHRELGLFEKERLSSLDKARVYRRVLEERSAIVWHTNARRKDGTHFEFDGSSPFAGSTTSKFKGVLIYPELMGLALWPELHALGTRTKNPYQLAPEDVRTLNREVFPYWLDRSILEYARAEAARLGLPAEDAPRFDLLEDLVFFITSKPNCISHTVPSFERAVSEGLRAVIEDAKGRAAAETEPARSSFYQAIVEALEGIIAYSRRLAANAEKLAAKEPDTERRTELERIAAIHRHVPEHRARSFREGLTTVWMCWIACHLENANVGLSLGRLDQLLWELYRQDIDGGKLSVDEAVELCCCFWLKIGDHVPAVPEAGEQLFGGTGSNQAITLGGVDAKGNDAVNDLTYVMLRATELMKLRDPNLNARYMPGVNSSDYLRRLCEVNLHTGATPALHNDRAVIAALQAAGDTLEQARDYAIIGCVEPGSAGRSYGHSGAILLNLTAALELALFDGRHRHTGLDRQISMKTGNAEPLASFRGLCTAFVQQVRWLVGEAIKVNEALGRAHQAIYPTPILSALFEGPMEKGLDLIDGGATLNASGVAIIGLADTADSLSAIRKVVFEEEEITLPDLVKAIREDFPEKEPLAARLMNPDKTPKWGREDQVGDKSVRFIVALLNSIFVRRTNYRGGAYRVGYWSMTNHAGFGRLTGALPSGRRAGKSFASGFTPVSGVAKNLTSALNSVAAVPAKTLRNGVAFNLKFTPALGDPKGKNLLLGFAQTVEGYFGGQNGGTGGMEIQFNVMRSDELAKAKDHPELLVRVSGYTAYFKDLTPEMQAEIIGRTEYQLSAGLATTPVVIQLPSARVASC